MADPQTTRRAAPARCHRRSDSVRGVQHEQHTASAPASADQPPPGTQAAVDRALAGLDGLAELPLAEHVARFDAVHTALVNALSALDRE